MGTLHHTGSPEREDAGPSPCTSCGACCAYSSDWPRFTVEEEEAIARLPEKLVTLSGMRCEGDRCTALSGEIGVATLCTVYADRPDVCRACQPGDDACRMARARFGLGEIAGWPEAPDGTSFS